MSSRHEEGRHGRSRQPGEPKSLRPRATDQEIQNGLRANMALCPKAPGLRAAKRSLASPPRQETHPKRIPDHQTRSRRLNRPSATSGCSEQIKRSGRRCPPGKQARSRSLGKSINHHILRSGYVQTSLSGIPRRSKIRFHPHTISPGYSRSTLRVSQE
jgi:hypothetical protein